MKRIQTNGVELATELYGDPSDPLILLLHGFPEGAFSWRKYGPRLAEAGWFVAAPDQRGYGTSDKPNGVKSYLIDTLVEDVIGLIDAFGKDKAVVVGHDWGSAVAWWLAMTRPERVAKLVAVQVPHPLVMRKYMFTHLSQLRRSWYMFFFQLPFLPEQAFKGRRLLDGIRRMARPGTFTEDDARLYLESWSRPGAPTAMVNWYRGALRMLTATPKSTSVQPETLIVWGKKDPVLEWRMAELSKEKCRSAKIHYFEDATHWVNHEELEAIIPLLLGFVNGD